MRLANKCFVLEALVEFMFVYFFGVCHLPFFLLTCEVTIDMRP